MNLDVLLSDDKATREKAREALPSLTEEQREAMATQLVATLPELVDAVVEGADKAEPRLTAALRALAALPGAASAMLTLVDHGTSAVRKALVRAVAYELSPPREALLERLVLDADGDVRHAAADAVTRLPWAGAVRPLLLLAGRGGVPTQQVTSALAAAAACADVPTQAAVAEQLLAVARSAADQATPFDEMQCLHALDALARFGIAFPGVREAAETFASSDEARYRWPGIAILAGAGDAARFIQLLEAAARGSTDEAAAANTWLRMLPPAAVAPALVDAMRHDDPLIRARAAELTVGTIFLAREAKVEPLLALTKDPDERVRAAAVTSLGRALPPGKAFFGDRKDVVAPALDALVSDPSKKVQEALQRARKVLGLG